MERDIKVTVWCTTYNHVDYIEDAINGFINQKCDFDYEIVIHDDCSTDGTIEILKKYENMYPKLIRVIYEKVNQHSLGNCVRDWAINQLHGKYIAICEGDDYWIDTKKLQIQFDYMEKHKECLLCGHNGLQYDLRTGKNTAIDGIETEKEVSVEEVLAHRKMCFPTASFFMRRQLFVRKKPYRDCRIGDWMTQLCAATEGKVYYFDRIMCVYRYYARGSWTANTYTNYTAYTVHNLDMAQFFDKYNRITERKYDVIVSRMIEGFYNAAASRFEDSYITDLLEYKKAVYEKLPFEDEKYWIKYLEVIEEYKREEEKIRAFASQYQRVFVMGTGDIADDWTERLNKWGISFEGYLISDDQVIKSEYHGKKVRFLKEMQNEAVNIGILIAIQKRHCDSVEANLARGGFCNYYWIKA